MVALMVIRNNKMYGKPRSKENALPYLSILFGNSKYWTNDKPRDTDIVYSPSLNLKKKNHHRVVPPE